MTVVKKLKSPATENASSAKKLLVVGKLAEGLIVEVE